ncbi:hypothetical protein SDC9_193450 [bioreactor metagenome]|uniref:Uncharacterized protein n=1 Tax=bioreactor metagenome TaxID=1076179 RepID=A0A645I3K4_9ZZZZ
MFLISVVNPTATTVTLAITINIFNSCGLSDVFERKKPAPNPRPPTSNPTGSAINGQA